MGNDIDGKFVHIAGSLPTESTEENFAQDMDQAKRVATRFLND